MYIHDYTMKQYKPGQFVSIDGKLARICKQTSPHMDICLECATVNEWGKDNCCPLSALYVCLTKLRKDHYPKLICGNQDK